MSSKCQSVDHPNLMPGWGCCQCKTYNGNQRPACKQCSHPRCDEANPMLKSYNPALDKKMN